MKRCVDRTIVLLIAVFLAPPASAAAAGSDDPLPKYIASLFKPDVGQHMRENWRVEDAEQFIPVVMQLSKDLAAFFKKYELPYDGTISYPNFVLRCKGDAGCWSYFGKGTEARDCVGLQDFTIKSLDKASSGAASNPGSIKGFHYAPLRAGGYAGSTHNVVIIWPALTAWTKTGLILDPWGKQSAAPDQYIYTLADWMKTYPSEVAAHFPYMVDVDPADLTVKEFWEGNPNIKVKKSNLNVRQQMDLFLSKIRGQFEGYVGSFDPAREDEVFAFLKDYIGQNFEPGSIVVKRIQLTGRYGLAGESSEEITVVGSSDRTPDRAYPSAVIMYPAGTDFKDTGIVVPGVDDSRVNKKFSAVSQLYWRLVYGGGQL